MIISRATSLPEGLADWLKTMNAMMAEAAARGLVPSASGARQALAGLTSMLGGQGPELVQVYDFRLPSLPDIPVRCYDPGSGGARPVLVYLHGGGHMAGSIDVYDPIVRRVARHTRCCTVAVEYRLAPEHPYPHGLDDCRAVVRAISAGQAGLKGKHGHGVIVAGDSAGGALTATLAAESVFDAGLAIHGQILVYPSLDYTLGQPSVASIGQGGYLLEADRIRWYFDHYFSADQDRKAASPLFMPKAGLPPTLIFTAGFCPLRDEGFAYAGGLEQAGVQCRHENFPDMIHAWLNMHTLVPQACERTYEAMGQWVKALCTAR